MPQTQPKFIIRFFELAVSAITRSAQGIVALILEDDVMTDNYKSYDSFGDVKTTDVSERNYKLLQLCAQGKPKKIIVVKKQEEISDTIEVMKKLKFNYYAMPSATAADMTALQSSFNTLRVGKKAFNKGVFANMVNPDDKTIINFVQSGTMKLNFTGEVEEYTPGEFTVALAGVFAGMPDTMSATYHHFAYIVDCDLVEDGDAAAAKGELIILFESGKYKLGRAINSLVSLTDGVSAAFQKIKIVSAMDLIDEDISTTFKDSYVGKYNNHYQNKVRFCGAINTYFKQLQPDLLDPNMANYVEVSLEKNRLYIEAKGQSTSELTDNEILQWNTGDDVLLDGHASPNDAMEDLDLSINLYAEAA